ncbi:MAG: hypothetical protein ACI8WB_005406 [Phenylobacterium sp.]|jgi:hypothetical protein
MSACFGVSQRLCIRSKDTPEAAFGYRYDPIANFAYVWGHRYQLKIAESQIENPPADGSSIATKLIAVIADVEDAVGSEYMMENVDMLAHTIVVQQEQYQFLGKPFTCSVELDCEALLNLTNTGGLLSFTFSYLGDGEIELIDYH